MPLQLEHTTYGEVYDPAGAAAKNLRGQVYEHYDSSGRQWMPDGYDFKGNPVTANLCLLKDRTTTDVDWNTSPILESKVYATQTKVDALNRPIKTIDPGSNTSTFGYDKGGALTKVTLDEEDYVKQIHYDAKGQRQHIVYGNNTVTRYTYDPLTYRLRRLLTTANTGGTIVQDLNYTYDPSGNITLVRDAVQEAIFFNNTMVSADQDFTYDALYRLVQASGREKKGLAAFGHDDNYDDSRWAGPYTGDLGQVHRYIQYYAYDPVGNITQLRHTVPSDTGYSYSRNYDYVSGTNRLLQTTVGADVYAYNHDTRGNMTGLPHITELHWNNTNELCRIDRITGQPDAWYQYSGGQRVRKLVKNGILTEERVYLGSFEIYRKFEGSSLTPILERSTIHISDDTGRIAMKEVRNPAYGTPDIDDVLVRYIYSNHLGSSSLELNENAAVISYEEYHPYGTTAYQAKNVSITTIAKRYRYTGKERDEESGLYYHGARYYVPWLCRWCAVDPLESKYAGMSPYNYSFNNPVMFNDPSGMEGENGWVRTADDKILYNSKIESQEDATEVYGRGTAYLNVGYAYQGGETGGSIVLGENGNWTLNGERRHAPDDAEFHTKEAGWGWLNGFASKLYSTFKSGQKPITIADLKEGLGETTMSLYKVSQIVNEDSYGHDEAMGELKHDFQTFLKRPSYNQGFVVGGYSYTIAENGILAYAMGAAAPKVPLRASVTAFEESFPGWYTTAPSRSSTAILNTVKRENLALGLSDDLYDFSTKMNFKNYNQFTSGGFQQDEILSAIQNPNNNLNFNLTGFKNWRYLKYTPEQPFNPMSPVSYNNITNWELYTIYNTPGALERTTFYKLIKGIYQPVPKPF